MEKGKRYGKRYGKHKIKYLGPVDRPDGIIGRYRYGYFQCPVCERKDWVVRVVTVKAGLTSKCKECANEEKMYLDIKPDGTYKDTGIRFIKRHTEIAKYGYFQCPVCEREDWLAAFSNITSGMTKCMNCSSDIDRKGTHKMTATRLYRVFYNMNRGCYDKYHNRYEALGGKYTVCKEWRCDGKKIDPVILQLFVDWVHSIGLSEKEIKEANLQFTTKEGECVFSPDTCEFITRSEATKRRFRNNQ